MVSGIGQLRVEHFGGNIMQIPRPLGPIVGEALGNLVSVLMQAFHVSSQLLTGNGEIDEKMQ